MIFFLYNRLKFKFILCMLTYSFSDHILPSEIGGALKAEKQLQLSEMTAHVQLHGEIQEVRIKPRCQVNI